MTFYIETADGTEIACGVPEHKAHRRAQELANELNEAVYMYPVYSLGESDDGACVQEISPKI